MTMMLVIALQLKLYESDRIFEVVS